MFRRAGAYVATASYAKVNQLPVEFATKFQLGVNLKAAKAIGLTTQNRFSHAPVR